jgi:type VI secretion system protein ImpH
MKASIANEGYRFGFFQAIRVLERLYPRRKAVGRAFRPAEEVVRIGTRPSLEFPASEIQEVARGEGDDLQPRMTVNFMGLVGLLGVLPRCYTEFLLERANKKDLTLLDFLDIFNHRMISLFYRAWEKYRFHVRYERDGKDDFSQYLCSLIGIGTPGLRDRLLVKDVALVFYSGAFAQRPRSASILERILHDYFGSPASVEQCLGRWIRLELENTTRLGTQNHELGRNSICGDRVWDRQSKFRIRLGPLQLVEFRRFLPCGDAFQELVQFVRLFAGMECDFDIQLILKAGEVPACQLLSRAQEGASLGWASWLKTREFTQDAQETVIESSI